MENSKNMLLYMNMSLSLISFARYAVCSLFSWKASAFSVFHFTWAVFKLRIEIKLWQCNILLYMGNLSEQQWLEWGVIVCIFFSFFFFLLPQMGTFWYFSGTTSARSKNILPVDWHCIVLSIVLSVFKLAYAKILHWCYIIWLPSNTEWS